MAVGAFLGGALTTDAEVTNNPESQAGYDLQDELFPQRFADVPTELIVVRSQEFTVDDPEFQTRLAELIEVGQATGSVVSAQDPREDESLVSPDRHAVLIPIRLEGDPEETVGAVVDAVEEENGKEGFVVAMTGTETTTTTSTSSRRATCRTASSGSTPDDQDTDTDPENDFIYLIGDRTGYDTITAFEVTSPTEFSITWSAFFGG